MESATDHWKLPVLGIPVAMFMTTLTSAEDPVPRSRLIVPFAEGVHSISKLVPALMTCPAVGAVIGLSCAKTPDVAKRSERAATTLNSIVFLLYSRKRREQ
jgi:hypothetical protein